MAKLPDPTELIGPGQAEPLDKEQLEKVIWDQCPNCESLRAELEEAQRKAVDRNGRLKKAEAELERVRELYRPHYEKHQAGGHCVCWTCENYRRIQEGEKDGSD